MILQEGKHRSGYSYGALPEVWHQGREREHAASAQCRLAEIVWVSRTDVTLAHSAKPQRLLVELWHSIRVTGHEDLIEQPGRHASRLDHALELGAQSLPVKAVT